MWATSRQGSLFHKTTTFSCFCWLVGELTHRMVMRSISLIPCMFLHHKKAIDIISTQFPPIFYSKNEATLIYLISSRQIGLKLRWSCWPPWGGLGGQIFLNIFWSMYRTFIILFPAQRKTLKTPSTYLEHDHKANRKIFRAFWKKSFASKWGFHQNILA